MDTLRRFVLSRTLSIPSRSGHRPVRIPTGTEFGLGTRTVVMYAGNLGFSQPLELMVEAARELSSSRRCGVCDQWRWLETPRTRVAGQRTRQRSFCWIFSRWNGSPKFLPQVMCTSSRCAVVLLGLRCRRSSIRSLRRAAPCWLRLIPGLRWRPWCRRNEQAIAVAPRRTRRCLHGGCAGTS